VNQIHSSCLCVTEWETRQQNGAVTRIETKRGEASHVRRSDRLLKPQLRCALHFVYCAARLLSFCFLGSCRFANCTICSLVAGFALMVYGYRIIVLRCRWLITPVIRNNFNQSCSSKGKITRALFCLMRQNRHYLTLSITFKQHACMFCRICNFAESRRVGVEYFYDFRRRSGRGVKKMRLRPSLVDRYLKNKVWICFQALSNIVVSFNNWINLM